MENVTEMVGLENFVEDIVNNLLLKERKALEADLVKVFRKFNLKDIALHILPLLPDINLEKIKKGLKKYKLKSTGENVGNVVIILLQKYSFEVIRHVYRRIVLLSVTQTKMFVWVPYTLLKPVAEVKFNTTEDTERLVLQVFRIEKMNADIYAHRIDNLLYVMVVNKKLTRNNGVKTTAPLYFCIATDAPYAFLPNKTYAQSTLLPIILKTFAFEEYKKVTSLSGKDVKSLLVTLLNKKNAVEEEEEMDFEVVPTVGNRVLACYNNGERLRHARHYLGNSSIVLEELRVNGAPEFMGNTKDRDITYKTSMVIRAKNVRQFLERLAWDGAMKPPFPTYIKKLNVIGKNKISLKTGN